MKTMGRVGLCTVESYIGGEFFEPNFLDTADEDLRRWFPGSPSPVGGVGLDAIAALLLTPTTTPPPRPGYWSPTKTCLCWACSKNEPAVPGTRSAPRPSSATKGSPPRS